MNFKNLSRYSELSEKTYRRQFSKAFEFVELNRRVIEQAMPAAARIRSGNGLLIHPQEWQEDLRQKLLL